MIERGRHVATAIALCYSCHSPNLARDKVLDDRLLGRLYTTNLTSGEGGLGPIHAAVDWIRAIRHGVKPNGQSMLLMPSHGLSRTSDGDMAALISYLEQVPPVVTNHPATKAG